MSESTKSSVLNRARRMARSELRKVAHQLGLTEYEPIAVMQAIGTLVTDRDKVNEYAGQVEQFQTDTQARIADLESRIGDLTAKLQAAHAEAATAKREAQEALLARESLATEYEIRDIALKSGLIDVEYGLHLLRGHLRGLPADQEPTDRTIRSFFEGLKRDPSKRALFREQQVDAGPRSLAEQPPVPPVVATQPAAEQPPAPAAAPKNPAPPSPAPPKAPEPNVLDMKKSDFVRRTREQYNYTPGMA